MTNNQELKGIIGLAYRAKAMGQGAIQTALNAFKARSEDPTFMDAARQELARVTSVPDRQCFVSKLTMDFLGEAIHAVDAAVPAVTPAPIPAPIIQADPLPLPTPTFTTTKEDDMTSKLKGLADIAKSTIADVENRASAAMDKLNKAQAHAHGGLDKIDGVTAEIEQAATDMDNFANQVSNGPPTE